ncbi:MAG TPA: cellobiose phosphorylase, partial [Hyphomicrobiales bacterium]|nr:cellobiose phosphorylase [Hyphomicrobiales bacterium]
LTVPHGLEQYAGSGWGTRDVCQGPVEFLLALGHVEPVKEILRRVFARQYIAQGDWPQWFMFEPYAQIEEPHSQGDTIIWPLKALCDYIESTNDLAFLSEQISWRQGARRAGAPDTVARHVDKLISRVNDCFIPGTHLPRLGAGDWNDTLQPVDLSSAQNTASSWTAALIFQQLSRYAKVLHSAGDKDRAFRLAEIADNIRKDFNRYLIRDGVAAGYAIFGRDGDTPELLLHPSDEKTGVSYSLIPMTCAITGGLFTPEQSRHHLQLIRSHLLFPDGVRLMDKPMPYHGGAERIFRRAEESSFFGREVGLMYVHAHLRYCEAMAVLGDADAVWDGLQVVNPISVTELLQHAAPRQRNCYFSSSDAAFSDRYRAIAEWHRVKEGSVPVEAGWRIYSSGPGLYISLLLSKFPGLMGRFGHKASLL